MPMTQQAEPVSATGVLGEAWQAYKAHWRHLLPIALIVYVIVAVVTLVLSAVLSWLGAIVGALFSIVAFFWLQGALVEAISDIRDGRADLSIGETFQRVRPRLGSIVVAGILAGIGIAVGLLLLIVPGLVLLTWWALIIPVIVLEQRSAGDSFSRSRELVRGHGWSVFGVVVLTILAMMVASIVIGILLSPFADWLQNAISNIVTGTLLAPFGALALTLLYFRLREAKGGAPGPQESPAP